MASSNKASDAAVIKATNSQRQAVRRQAAQEAEAEFLVNQAKEPRRAKEVAKSRDWNQIINGGNRSSKRAGNFDKSTMRKKAKLSDDEDSTDAECQQPKASSHSQTIRPRPNRVPPPRKRKPANEDDDSGTSDTGSDAFSKTNPPSEEEDRFSEDDLTKQALVMDEDDLLDLYESEQVKVVPARAGDLFNSDDHVVSARPSSRASKDSSRGSGPPTSDDARSSSRSGGGYTSRTSDPPSPDADLDNDQLPRSNRLSHGGRPKNLSKREQVFTNERAHVAPADERGSKKLAKGTRRSHTAVPDSTIPPVDSDDENMPGHQHGDKDQRANDTELQWSRNIRVLYDDGIKISQQNTIIRTVIAEVIRRCKLSMLTENAFTETGRRVDFRYQTAMQAIKFLRTKMEQNEDYELVYARAKKDSHFVNRLGEVGVDHLSHYRSEIRTAALTHIAVYQLGTEAICEQRVAALLDGNVFVYPGHWAQDQDKDVWVPKRRLAYLNPAIINTLKSSWFSSDQTIGNQHRHVYTSSLPERPNEKEFTIPLVALAATSVFMALFSWSTGLPQAKTQQFRGELVMKTYRTFATSLAGFKQSRPAEFHRIMSSLYTAVCGVCSEDRVGALGDDPFIVFEVDDT